MPKDTTDSSNLQQDTEINLNCPTFEQYPHDAENPYVVINRDLTRNAKLSFEARGFLYYLLSHSKGWVINRSYIIRSQNIKEHSLKKIIDELIKIGHVKMERYVAEKGYRRVKYLVSEYPRFKENIPHREIPSEEIPDREKHGTKEVTIRKEITTNKKSSSPKPEVSEEVKKLSETFLKEIQKEKTDFKPPSNFYNWNDCFDKMLRIDGRDVDKVIAVIEWVTHDPFWKANILSPSKLREKFDQLELKMLTPNTSGVDPEKNKKMAIDFSKKYAHRSKDFFVGESYIEFIYGGQTPSSLIDYSDKKFIEKVKSALMKWGNHE